MRRRPKSIASARLRHHFYNMEARDGDTMVQRFWREVAMAALAHIAVGFASKPLGKGVPVGILVGVTVFLDLLAMVFSYVGLEANGSISWSHGLLMSLVWSAAMFVLFALVYRSYRIGLVVGLLVFSHWVIDFITHPMGAVFGGHPLPPDMPLLLDGSRKVGLGLYNSSIVGAYVIEFASLAIGLAVYVAYTVRAKRRKESSGA